MRITKQYRGRKPTKRMDLSDMRSLFLDRRVWAAIGTVYKPAGVEHWHLESGSAGEPIDIIVEVELQPSQVTVSARLKAGLWEVPSVGDEVALLVPDGAIDFQPIIVGLLSSGAVPATQGPQPGRIVIAKPEVLIHDGTGGAVSLAKLLEIDALADDFYTHVHIAAGSPTAGPVSAIPPNDPLVDPGRTGTEVLKAK